MSGTWPTFRAALKAQLNGVTVDLGASYDAETMMALEYAAPGRQDASNWPYCVVLPEGRHLTRESGGDRVTTVPVTVLVMLAPFGASDNQEYLQQRYDAWCDALSDALDDAISMDGTSDIAAHVQDFGRLEQIMSVDEGWGFELILPEVQISEAKTFSA